MYIWAMFFLCPQGSKTSQHETTLLSDSFSDSVCASVINGSVHGGVFKYTVIIQCQSRKKILINS